MNRPKSTLRTKSVLARPRPCQRGERAHFASTSGFVNTSLVLLTIGGISACQPPQTGNDPKALYAYLENKHTFIVSHVFTEDIYQNSFGVQFPAVRNPDTASNNTFTCFYEIRLDQQQMEQCARRTNISAFTQPEGNSETGARPLTTTDVWRLMAINPNKVSGTHSNVIPTAEMIYNIRNSWDSNVEAIQSDLQLQAAQLALNDGTVTRANLSGDNNTGTLLSGVLSGFLQRNQQPVQQAAINSAACLAVHRASPNPLQSLTGTLLGFVGNWIGGQVGVLRQGVGQAALGLGLGYLNNLIGRTINPNTSALEEAQQQCRRDIAANIEGDGQIPQQVSPQTVLQSAAAIQNNDVSVLRALLEKEIERDVNAMTEENAEVARQLAPTFSALTAQQLHVIRENIINAAQSSQSLNSLNGARCLAAQRFATDVLKLALIEANTGDTAQRLNQWTGCADGSSAVSQTTEAETPTATSQSKAQTTPSPDSSATQENKTETNPQDRSPHTQPPILQSANLNSQISQIQAALEQVNQRITQLENQSQQTGEPLPDVPTHLQSAGLTAVQQSMGIAPQICHNQNGFDVQSKISDGKLTEQQFTERVNTCAERLQSSDQQHIYDRFNDSLRRICAEKSSPEPSAQATCFCSCRWDADFFEYLNSSNAR